MNNICVKLRQRERVKYRKMLSLEESVYPDFDSKSIVSSPYSSGAVLEAGEWFCINEASKQEYALDLFGSNLSTVDFEALDRRDFSKIDFLFVLSESMIFFQKITKARLVAQKRIFQFGESFQYLSDCSEIAINSLPDAIYDKNSDCLFFYRIESITSIFTGIDQLYKEATQEEVAEFLNNDFICLKDGYTALNVKTANRKRIALAKETLSKLNESERENIFSYIVEYCPDLSPSKQAFDIESENDLKLLLFGIEQRFYTTHVGSERRIANSIVLFE